MKYRESDILSQYQFYTNENEKKQLTKILTKEQLTWCLEYSQERNFIAKDFLFIHKNLSQLSYPQMLKQLTHFKSKEQLYTIAKNLNWKKTAVIYNRTKYFEDNGETITDIKYFIEYKLIKLEKFEEFKKYVESSKFTLNQMRIVFEGLKQGYDIAPLHRQSNVSIQTIYKFIKRFELADNRILAYDYLSPIKRLEKFILILNDKIRGYPDDKYIDIKHGINVGINQKFKEDLKRNGIKELFSILK